MDQDIERHWRRVMLWQRGFLAAVLAIGLVGAVIAARSGDVLTVGQFAAVAVIAVGGLIWNVVHVRRWIARTSLPTSNV
ncbi:hypothetical protein ABZX85_17380 [Streptomyces sp. NPDC004539]|uniref:hypothetical protein n=1 Tax=Streptomyces sp. NPDC004539 TaxID=3154280 RepID=UPI0033BCCAC0